MTEIVNQNRNIQQLSPTTPAAVGEPAVKRPKQIIEGFTRSKSDQELKWSERNITDIYTLVSAANFTFTESFMFKYGGVISSVGAALGGYFINNHFREALYLMHYGRISSYLPIVALPVFFTSFTHYHFVTTKIAKEEFPSCPICLQVRAALVNLGWGVAYPLFMSQVVSYNTLSGLKTNYSAMPNIIKNPKGVYEVAKSIIIPMKNKLLILVAINMLLPMTVTYFEQTNFYDSILPRLLINLGLKEKPELAGGAISS